MYYSFDVEVAKVTGTDGAIMLHNLNFWINTQKANKTNFHDGNYWMYNSVNAFSELFPFWSRRQLQRVLKNLVEDGFVITGNYNKHAYDRTLWYSLTEKFYSITPNGVMQFSELGNEVPEPVQTIPDGKPDGKPDGEVKTPTPPTLNECKEAFKARKQSALEAKKFFDYYNARGWVLSGGLKIKDYTSVTDSWCAKIKDFGSAAQNDIHVPLDNYAN